MATLLTGPVVAYGQEQVKPGWVAQVVCGCLISSGLVLGTGVAAAAEQATLSEQLLSESAAERSDALEAVKRTGAGRASQEVRAALIEALRREAMLHRQRDIADRRGDNTPALDDPELLGRLVSTVAELREPASIPALAGALGTGFGAVRALAAFGESAVPAILTVEASPHSGTDAVNHALIALRLIAEGASQSLGIRTRDDLRGVAARRLRSGKGVDTTTLWWAIDLAWIVQDAALRRSIEALAADPNVVMSKGITDAGLIEQTQSRASARIAGIPPLPRQWR